MFEPKGAEPMWAPIYRTLSTLPVGAVLAYDVLAEAVGWDIRVDRAPFYRALRELERENSRSMANVPGTGYRVVEAREHGDLARKHQRRSARQVVKAGQKLASADRAHLTAEERERFDSWELRLKQAETVIRRLHARTTVLEKRTAETAAGQKTLEQDMTRVKTILSRHGLLTEEKAA